MTKKDNGQTCSLAEECLSDNCGGGVCCASSETCCDANADCPQKYECDKSRFYCVPSEDESAGEEATKKLTTLQSDIEEIRKRAPDLSLTSVESLITQANEKLSSGKFTDAYKLVLDARSELEKAKKKISLGIGVICFEDLDCESGNCKNKICCQAGERCCSKLAHCKKDEVCEPERFFCITSEEEDEKKSVQDRILGKVLEILNDPMQLITVIGAVVLGVGVGVLKLRSKLQEEEKEKELEAMRLQMQQQQQQPQYYQGPGGQWYQMPPGYDKQSPQGQGGWEQPPNQGW